MYRRLLDVNWATASLRQNNAFTVALVLRSAGLLVHTRHVEANSLEKLVRTSPDLEVDEKKKPIKQKPITDRYRQLKGKTLRAIIEHILRGCPGSLRVQDYPAAPAIAYWTVDAAVVGKVDIPKVARETILSFATDEFRRHVSFVTSDDHVNMDPIGMVMAACLCRATKKTAAGTLRKSLADRSPSDVELRAAVKLFFEKQNRAGVWEKYFPLFHYPTAGSNHCWHFEVLEAILNEFPEILRDARVLTAMGRSLDWLKANRLHWPGKNNLYSGWNSGGDFRAMSAGQPESWPTGVAHMYLSRLQTALSAEIRALVMEKYADHIQRFPKSDDSGWHNYLDCDLPMNDEPYLTVKAILEGELIAPAEACILEQGIQSPGDSPKAPPRHLLPSFRLSGRRSALLFGPPGTSKTSLAEAIAQRLGWPFVELTPSDFVAGGLERIYDKVSEVFADLEEMYGVVVLFDEMDALVQSRESIQGEIGPAVARLDVTQRFLTTSMLPKLLKLHKSGRSIFFMATNHQREFDPAIKRAGRFDLLIRLGPPSVAEKGNGIERGAKQWFKSYETERDRKDVKRRFDRLAKDERTNERWLRFTYGEVAAFFDHIRRKDPSATKKNLATALKQLDDNRLKIMISAWAKESIALSDGSAALREFTEDADAITIH
jgi:hypothetical protein